MLSGFDVGKLKTTIPFFHDLNFRYRQFCNAMKNGNPKPIKESHGLIVFEMNCKKYNLTPREIEIVNLIITGQSYKIIGYSLNISEKTVARHVSNVFSKVSASNKVDLINKLEVR